MSARSLGRMARRDLRRSLGPSLLVMMLVGLPVLVGVALVTWAATAVLDHDDMVAASFGAAPVIARSATSDGSTPPPSAGGRTGEQAARDLAAMTGGDVTPRGERSFVIDETSIGPVGLGPGVQAIEIDGRSPLARGIVELRSGRWPQTTSEILVGEEAARAGLTAGTTVTGMTPYRDPAAPGWGDVAGTTRTYTVVGTARTRAAATSEVAVVRLPDGPAHRYDYLLSARPTGKAVTELAHLVTTVETREDLAAGLENEELGDENAELLPLLVVPAFLLVGVGSLAAGPALALLAARQRRTLTQLSALGARPADLGSILGRQVLVLGGLAVTVASVLGVGSGLLLTRWFTTGDIPGAPVVPAAPILLIAVAALAASTLHARTVPVRPTEPPVRPDADPGRRPLPPVRRRTQRVGTIVLAVGVVAVIAPAVASLVGGADVAWAVSVLPGLVAVVVGVLMLVPTIVTGLARRRLPLLVRLAARDLERRRDVATPVVAAVMGSTLLLGAAGLLAATIPQFGLVPTTAPAGGASVPVSAARLEEMTAEIARRAPGTDVHLLATAAGTHQKGHPSVDPPNADSGWILVPPGCSVAQVNPWAHSDDACGRAPGTENITWLSMIAVAEPEAARRVQGLSDDAVAALERGEILVSSPELVADGAAVLQPVRTDFGGGRYGPTGGQPVSVPARVVGRFPVAPDTSNAHYDALVTPETATRIGMVWNWGHLVVTNPDGRLTGEQTRSLRMIWIGDIPDGVSLPDTPAPIGAPFGAPGWPAGLLALLVIVVGATSTAVVRGERRAETTTLVTIGARPGQLRGVAALHATLTVGLGCLLGFSVATVATGAQAVVSAAMFAGGPAFGTTDALQAAIGAVPWGMFAAVTVASCLGSALAAAALTDTRSALDRRPS